MGSETTAGDKLLLDMRRTGETQDTGDNRPELEEQRRLIGSETIVGDRQPLEPVLELDARRCAGVAAASVEVDVIEVELERELVEAEDEMEAVDTGDPGRSSCSRSLSSSTLCE